MAKQLTSKQRAKLRGMAQTLEPILHIGKEGMTDNIIKQADDALEARELIKGTVQQNSALSAKEALEEICRQTGAHPVASLGRRFVLYRESENKKQIEL